MRVRINVGAAEHLLRVVGQVAQQRRWATASALATVAAAAALTTALTAALTTALTTALAACGGSPPARRLSPRHSGKQQQRRGVDPHTHGPHDKHMHAQVELVPRRRRRRGRRGGERGGR
eukprot:scaffold9262_cov36-Phaeocystis_antarctica.AAC.2